MSRIVGSSMSNPWIAYVGPFNFPWGQAGSRRVYGNARSLMLAGYNVTVCSGDAQKNITLLEHDDSTGSSIFYVGMGELCAEKALILRSWRYLFEWGRRTVSWLSQQPTKPAYVILYGGLAAYAWNLYSWCRANNVPIIADVVEWYDPAQMAGGRLGPFYLSANLAFHFMYPRFDGVIAISSYLSSRFERHLPTVTIPPTCSFAHFLGEVPETGSTLRLIYAGTPGKKDLLSIVVAAIARVEAEGVRLKMDVIGPSELDVLQLCGLSKLPHSVNVHGRLPQEEVLRFLSTADFSVLIRPSVRFTNAGFPTKFVESLSAATPVIANITSDLGDYLVNGFNGFKVDHFDVDSLSAVLRRASKLSSVEKFRMKEMALLSAKQNFSSDRYIEDLRSFLLKVSQEYALRFA